MKWTATLTEVVWPSEYADPYGLYQVERDGEPVETDLTQADLYEFLDAVLPAWAVDLVWIGAEIASIGRAVPVTRWDA
jgi:hypothetical protein